VSDGLRAFLGRVQDTTMANGLRRLIDRFVALEGQVTSLDQTVLKTGSPVDAYEQRIKRVGDPKYDTDAVSLGYMRKFVNATIQAQTPPPAPTRDAGPGVNSGQPPPSGTFTATPSSLGAGGGTVTFNWSTQNATSVEHSVYGVLPLSGSATLVVTTSTVFTLLLRGPGGISALSVNVTVAATPPPTATPTGSFVAIPTTIAPGQVATLSWTSANATSVQISPGVGAVAPIAAGSTQVAPTQTTTYDLRLDGPGGTKIYQVTVTVTTAPPPPTPGSMVAGVLSWGFSNNGVRFPWKGMTAFLVLRDLLDPARAYKAYQSLDWMAAAGITVPRIICSLAGPFWENKGFELYPSRHANFFTTVAQMVEYCNSKGMIPEVVIFGSLPVDWAGSGGGYDLNLLKAHTRAFATALLPYRGCFIEIANEWDAIGFTSGQHVRDLANEYLSVDPARILACSSATGDSDNYTGYLQPPSVYLTIHNRRDPAPYWVTNHFGNPTISHGIRPAVSDEPVNAGPAQFGVHEDDPQYWYAYAAMSRIMGFSTTFHYEGGLFDDVPSALTYQCFTWWMAAQSYPSPDDGGQLFAATPAGIAFGPCPWANSGSNLGLIGRTIAGGSAYAIVFGPDVLPATGTGWQPAQVDGLTSGGFYPPGATPIPGGFSFIRGYFVAPKSF